MRLLSAEIDGVTHHVLIENPEFATATVGTAPVRLPARVVCEVARHGRTPRGPGSMSVHRCTNQDPTCMSCLVHAARLT